MRHLSRPLCTSVQYGLPVSRRYIDLLDYVPLPFSGCKSPMFWRCAMVIYILFTLQRKFILPVLTIKIVSLHKIGCALVNDGCNLTALSETEELFENKFSCFSVVQSFPIKTDVCAHKENVYLDFPMPPLSRFRHSVAVGIPVCEVCRQ